MATVRFSYALIVSASLLWVYSLLILVFSAASRLFPRRGIILCQIFLASFISGLFLLVLWILCPLAALENFFIVSLVPLFCVSSGIFQRINSLDINEAVSRACGEAGIWGLLLLILALIREPLGLLSLSVPGGAQGIIFLFSVNHESLFPVRIIAGSSGALLLLGYGVGLYRFFRSINAPREMDI